MNIHKLLLAGLLIIGGGAISFADNEFRLVLEPKEGRNIDITDIPGAGLAAMMGGDSITLLDTPDLQIAHMPIIADTRQLVVTDSAIYCTIRNYICRMDSVTGSLQDVAVFDNNQFNIYPACGNSLFVVTADNDFSDCALLDPDNGLYNDVLSYEGLIRKITASKDHVFAWIDNCICLIGENQSLATLISDPTIKDIVLTPSGLVVANRDGLWIVVSPTETHRLLNSHFAKLWYVNSTLYLQCENGAVVAIDDFSFKATSFK